MNRIDPLYLHRLLRLSDHLEVDDKEISQVDDDECVFYCRGNKYRVLAEDEVEKEIRKRLFRIVAEHEIQLLVEYMYLPSARSRIMKVLVKEYDDTADVGERLLLSPREATIDGYFRGESPKQWKPCISDKERAGRFLIYKL